MRLLRAPWRALPEGKLKRLLRRALNPGEYGPPRGWPAIAAPLVREIARLEVEDAVAGPDAVPFIKLAGGPTFRGHGPGEREVALYELLPEPCRSRIPRGCIRVAADVVLRYYYPHAQPGLTPPYSWRDRAAFHPQHRDTIDDMPGLSAAQKARLKERFRIRPGHVVLDVGAYLGYGDLKMAELVGADGLVIAVEADADNFRMLETNLAENGVRNVRAVATAVSDVQGQGSFYCNERQENSLVQGIVDTRRAVTVPTDTVDHIVSQAALGRLDLVSLTINGAEREAVGGMEETIRTLRPNVLAAGWYRRDGVPVHEAVVAALRKHGYETALGRMGRVYAWPGGEP